jgi:hypothetical protein
MLRKSGIIFVMLIAVAALVMASASAVSAGNSKKTDNDDWVAIPATLDSWSSSISSGTFSATSTGAYYTVQGQSRYFSYYVPNNWYGITVDLNWGNSENSLQYTMYAADGSVAGPYYDNADGRIDGRIYICLSRNGAIIPSGTYYDRVYGYKVTGAEDYTI